MSTQTILAFDTCTDLCSVALYHQGQVSSSSVEAQRSHSEKLLPMIETILLDAKIALSDIDYLATSQGPGSFTGVRICNSVAQGLAYGGNLQVVEISTLATLAQEAISQNSKLEAIYCALDARMGEIYFATYQNKSGIAVLIGEENVLAPSELLIKDQLNTALVGTGFEAYPELSGHLIHSQFLNTCQFPRAQYMLEQAKHLIDKKKVISSFEISPKYLRNNVAWKK